MSNSALVSFRIYFPIALLLSSVGGGLLSAQAPVATETVSASLATGESPNITTAESSTATTHAERFEYPVQLHAWARFPVGAWREIEITTETFGEKGTLFGRSVTTQKEVLKAITEDSYVVDVQATVDVSGKRIQGPWNTRVLRLVTDRAGPILNTSQRPEEMLAFDTGAVSCQVWDVHYSDENRNMRDRIFFSPEVFPHVLQREVSEQAEVSPVELPSLDSMRLVARAVPCLLEGRVVECACQQIVRRRDKGNSQSISMVAPEVPGGEVESWSTDFDSEGRRIRWSVLKIIAYGSTDPIDEQERLATPPTTAVGRQK